MKTVYISIYLFLFLAQLPFPWFQPEKPEEKPSPVKGWWVVSYFAVPPTQYSMVGKGVIKAESLGSRASLYKRVDEKQGSYPVLSWGWKISNVVRSAIETRKDRFDAAARVIVVFGQEGPLPMVGQGEPQGFKIDYIWSSRLPVGKVFDHPGERNRKVFVLESGEKKAGQWVYESRNIQKDFRVAFDRQPMSVIALGIETDTDHSNERVTAYYSEPFLKRK